MDLAVLNTVKLGDSGDPILVMHGWGQSMQVMRPLGELLSKYGRVHLIDLPGFGGSPHPGADWDTVDYAERIYQYIKDENLQAVHLVGHSFGGRVSIRLASRHSEVVKSVILVNSGGLKRKLSGTKLVKTKLIGMLGKVLKSVDKLSGARTFAGWFAPKFGSTDYKNAGALRTILVKTVNEDVSADAGKITAPTFLLWGEVDQETPLEMGQRLQALITGARLVVLPGKDHFPFIGDGAHLCAHHILKFLQAQPSAGEVS